MLCPFIWLLKFQQLISSFLKVLMQNFCIAVGYIKLGYSMSNCKCGSVFKVTVGADRFCWICHKEGGTMLKCIACPRVYHSRCHFQGGLPEGPSYDPSTFHCPECSAVLKADSVNTRYICVLYPLCFSVIVQAFNQSVDETRLPISFASIFESFGIET